MKQQLSKVKSQINPRLRNKDHVQWEFLNTEFENFLQNSQKSKAKLRCEKLSLLKVKPKDLEQNLSNGESKEPKTKLIKPMTK